MTIMKKAAWMCMVVLALCLCLCAGPAFSALEMDRTRTGTAASIPSGFLSGPTEGPYLVSAGDLLEIYVWKDPELTRDIRVRPDGKFNYPLIGTIEAAGKTVEDLQALLKERLAQYIRFPEVTVTVKESSYSKVVVLGEVVYPGVYPYRGSIDVLTAIGLAGDFTRDGKRESVLVISDNFTNNPKVRRLNVFKSFYWGTCGSTFVLKPNDIVYVPRTFIADWNKTVNELQPTFDLIANLMAVRTDIKTIYYNRDRPTKAQ